MSTKTITGDALVWISKHSRIGPGNMPKPEDISDFTFTSAKINKAHWLREGYTEVGTATITVNTVDEKALIENKVEALKAEAVSIRAEATAKVTQIEGQIQSLLAITCDSSLMDAP
jgi:hypothetical protein